jgi:hypothetical protein
MGNSSIEFFSSSYKFIFWLLTFETLAFVSIRLRNPGLLFSIPIAYLMLYRGIGVTTIQDYIDVPVAFFSLLSVAVILPPLVGRESQEAVNLSLLLASGAAMTKQVGLYMIGAIPLLLLC